MLPSNYRSSRAVLCMCSNIVSWLYCFFLLSEALQMEKLAHFSYCWGATTHVLSEEVDSSMSPNVSQVTPVPASRKIQSYIMLSTYQPRLLQKGNLRAEIQKKPRCSLNRLQVQVMLGHTFRDRLATANDSSVGKEILGGQLGAGINNLYGSKHALVK